VVSKVIWGYEYGKIEGEFKPRNGFTYIVDTPLTVAAETVSDNWVNKIAPAPPVPGVAPKVVLGPVASGDKVVDDVTNSFFQKVLNHFPKLVAVEMEGAGAAAAIQSAREKGRSVGFVMIRGISDMPVAGDGAAPTRAAAGGGSDAGGAGSGQTQQRARWKKFAAAAAATFAVRVIQEAWPVPPAAEA